MNASVKKPVREIGGYLELEHLSGQEYYPDLFHFNLGRTAAVFFLQQAGCRTVLMPYFMCDSVKHAADDAALRQEFYHIQADFSPDEADLPEGPLPEDTWLYLNDSYGLLSDACIRELRSRYGNVLLDYTHSFFRRPPAGMAAVTSIRKYIGVTDGAYLQSDRPLSLPDEQDQSHCRFSHLLGRYEAGAGAFYQQMLDNAHSYDTAPASRMSPLTQNLLCGLNYEEIARRRTENALVLAEKLDSCNLLLHPDKARRAFPEVFSSLQASVSLTEENFHHMLHRPGPFVYPLLVQGGSEIRKALARHSVFVPTYWSEVAAGCPENSIEACYAANILALPCDQRYTEEDMRYMTEVIHSLL